jgi:beta-phosphoglucomutase
MDHRRAVLWDMDGTLVDSGEYHFIAWREALAREGIDLSRERFTESFGQRNDEILRGHFGPNLPDEQVARIGDAKEVRYRQLVCENGLAPLPGVRAWLTRLASHGWHQAIASSAPRQNIATMLDALGLTGLFDATACAEDVERGKPDPQIYLVAASRLEVEPERCVVVEDAPAGIEAARRAGMRVVGVRFSHPDLDADRVVDSLEELPDDAFEQLLLQPRRRSDR